MEKKLMEGAAFWNLVERLEKMGYDTMSAIGRAHRFFDERAGKTKHFLKKKPMC